MAGPTVPRMRFLCFGAGAIGSYVGGSLALAGHRVHFFERPEPVARLQASGLTLWQGAEARKIATPLAATSLDDLLTHGPFDAAILAVKAYDTASLMQSIAPYRMALPPVICFQNGVENETLVAASLGSDKVISGTITTAIGRKGQAEIVVERLRGMGLADEHILAPTLVAVLSAAGLRARLYPNAASMKWSKMLTNLLGNASSAILDMPASAIFAHPGLFRMEIQMLREALQVMRAQKIAVVDLPDTPVLALARIASLLPPALSQPILRRALGGGRGAKMPSFHIDLHSARGKSEVDFLNGAVVRFGQRQDRPTPVNALLNQTLLALTNGEIPLDTYAHKPDEFLKLLNPSS